MKIHILGALGSGVTTLGKALSETLHCHYFDSDNFFFEPSDPPFTIKRNIFERNTLLEKELSITKDWILGGSIVNWKMNLPQESFDLVIFLYIPQDTRIERLSKREFFALR